VTRLGDKRNPKRLTIIRPNDSNGRTIWIADAHRDDGKRFVVHTHEKLTAFLELESAKDKVRPDSKVDHRMKRKRGRPTLFNAGLAARLCRLLARGWWPLLVKLRSGHSRACRTCERYNPLFNASFAFCRSAACAPPIRISSAVRVPALSLDPS
jgi:hypothetical protein